MARLCAFADGNFTAAGTWETIDGTLFLDSQSNNTANTTAYVACTAQTPGAITIDGVAVKIASRIASPTGTMSVRLATGGVLVAGTEVTVNVSDLPRCDAQSNTSQPLSGGEGGWFFLLFAAPVLLVAATAYTVDMKGSVNSEFNLYRDGTAGNWSHFVRTTTTAAPGAGDDMVITAEWTAAATKTDRTVTMNETASTDYGAASTDVTKAALAICKGGSLTYGTTAATNYVLRLSGYLQIYSGGVLSIGTTGTPIPRDSTAVLEFDCASDGQFGGVAHNEATVNFQGLSRSSGKDIVYTKLTADMAASATSATVADDTGWKSGDEVVFSPTTRTYSDSDRKSLNADAGASSLAWTGGTTFAHLGTSPTQGEAILLTRNVKIRSVSSSNMTFFMIGRSATLDADWTEFRYFGVGASGKWGVQFENGQTAVSGNNGSFTMHYCSIYDVETISTSAWGTNGTYTIDHCCFAFNSDTNRGWVYIDQRGWVWTVTNNVMCRDTFPLQLANGPSATAVWANNIVSGCFVNMGFGGIFVTATQIPSTWSGNEFHSNRGQIQFSGDGRLSGGHYIQQWKIWHTSTVVTGGFYVGNVGEMTFDRCEAYGNNGTNWQIDNSIITQLTFLDCKGNGTSSFSTTNNINFTTNTFVIGKITMESCLFSVASGVLTACTNDVNFSASSSLSCCPIWGDNSKFSGTNVTANISTMVTYGLFNGLIFLRSQRHGQTDDDHRMFTPIGTIKTNASVFNSAAPSAELQPSSATYKLKLPLPKIPIDDGATISITVAVRKSAAYNGNAPRLILKRKDSLGYTADVTADTLSVGADTWEDLTYTTAASIDDGMVEFYIDCDGTAGSVYVDDVRVS